MNIKNFKLKKAYTLSEILIGVTLGIIVSEMAVRMLGNIINTDEYEKNMVTMQSDAMHVAEMLTSDLKKAGLFLNDNTNNQPFDWTRTSDNPGSNDSIAITYQNINSEYNCSSFIEMPNINNHYYVADGDLYCNNVVLLQNIESFQLLYGIDLNGDGVVNRYLNATQAEPISLDTNYRVVDVKFDITVASTREFTDDYDKIIFTPTEGEQTYSDGKIYRTMSRSTVLKNMLQ